MSGVAHLLLDKGCRPTGSDLRHSELTTQLEMRGVKITYSACPEKIKATTCVIAPMSFPESHPEIQAAMLLGIPVLRRASALAEICADSNCTSILCFGTTARGKLPWLFHKCPKYGRCAGSAISSIIPVCHAALEKNMMIDIDEREFLCDPDAFESFLGSDVILSDWQNDDSGYYQQKSFAQKYVIPSDWLLPQIRKRILDKRAIIIAPDENTSHSSELKFSAFSQQKKQEEAVFKVDSVGGLLYPPEQWQLPAMPIFGTNADASALAAALFWRYCRNIPVIPEDVECTGWFREIAVNQFHDIRMHPVNLRNAVSTLRTKAGSNPVGIAIKPFGQTLSSYSPEKWQNALKGTDRLLVILPPYEGCSEEAAREFAESMKGICGEIMTVTAEQAHELLLGNEFRLWSGAGDIL